MPVLRRGENDAIRRPSKLTIRPAGSSVGEHNKGKRDHPEAQEAAAARRPDQLAGDDSKETEARPASHIDLVILLDQAGKNSHEHICKSLDLFGREVMPEFQNDPRRQRGIRVS
jgi:hypothetical protein